MVNWQEYLEGIGDLKAKDCSVGNIESITMGWGVIKELPEMIRKENKKTLVLFDENTFEKFGGQIESLLTGLAYKTFVYPDSKKVLVPDETAVGHLLIAARDVELIVTIGSGVLNDTTRFICYQKGIKFFIVTTAPSMDGYASDSSPLIINSFKTTVPGKTPNAIIADLDLVSTAPDIMLASGAGDIFGKFTCLCDWKLSNMITGEKYNDNIVNITKLSMDSCVQSADGLPKRTKESMEALMEGLILSGLAMSYCGTTRPASGAEHHIAHYWEMRYIWEDRTPVLHGTKVGITALVVIKLYNKLLKENIDWHQVRQYAAGLSFDSYKERVQKGLAKIAPAVIAQEIEEKTNSKENILARIDLYEKNWPAIQSFIKEQIPQYDEMKKIMASTGGQTMPQEIGVERELFHDAIRYAKEVRRRFTVLQILFDLGLLDRYAEEVTSEYYGA